MTLNVGNKIRTVSDELVPLAQRMRYLRLFRLAMSLGVIAFAAFAPDVVGASPLAIGKGAAVFLAVSFAAEGAWRLLGRRGLVLFGATLIVDGVFLAWMAYLTGGVTSTLLTLILLHVVVVTLMASYRTGLKLTMWHSLLLLMIYQLQEAAIPVPGISGPPALTADAFHRLVGFIGVCWVAALATASFSAINERELRRRRFDLEALAKMASSLETVSEGRDVAGLLLDGLIDTFSFTRGTVLAKLGDDVSVIAARGEGVPTEASVIAADPLMHQAWKSRRTLLVPAFDAEANPGLSTLFPQGKNLLVVPLTAEGGSVGVVVLEHGVKLGSRIERRVVSMVERFSSHAALALRNASLVDQLRDMAATDGLTGVANRRTFEAALQVELTRASRAGSAVSLVLIDIDHFKELNDTHGHQVGDEVLRGVAKLLREQSRAFDTPARYGGEEFAVIMPGCDIGDAERGAERLRRAIAAMETVTPVTVSTGVATFPVHAADADSLVQMADGALYASKGGGRNRTTVARRTLADAADELLTQLSTAEGEHGSASDDHMSLQSDDGVQGPTGPDGTSEPAPSDEEQAGVEDSP
jgi:diguanylate cyclase (GGDEF)-like protein